MVRHQVMFTVPESLLANADLVFRVEGDGGGGRNPERLPRGDHVDA
jgi:hypothetical protein